jgi:hypothetical protein
MTHVRVEDITTVHRRSSCRKGEHRFGNLRSVGGGILRRVCLACGSVSIELTTLSDAGDGEGSDHLES